LIKPSPAIRRAVSEAARTLEKRGLIVEEWRPPYLVEMWRVYIGLLLADGFAGMRRASRGSQLTPYLRGLLSAGRLPRIAFPIGGVLCRLAGQPQFAESIRSSAPLNADEYWSLVERRKRLCAEFLAALDAERFDAILCPTCAVPALRHQVSLFINEAVSYTAVYNLLGMPAGVVAAGRVRPDEESDRFPGVNLVERACRKVEENSAGLPISVQVVARPWREDVALRIMAALEEHFREQPDYPARPPL
jgi:fatty acid amide hydrolase